MSDRKGEAEVCLHRPPCCPGGGEYSRCCSLKHRDEAQHNIHALKPPLTVPYEPRMQYCVSLWRLRVRACVCVFLYMLHIGLAKYAKQGRFGEVWVFWMVLASPKDWLRV